MNDEFAPKSATADDWEISLPEILPTAKDTSVQPPSEEWAMAQPVLNQPQAETAEDWGMTNPLTMPPDAAKMSESADGWQLPAPVFRSSEGAPPKKNAAAPVIESAPETTPLEMPDILPVNAAPDVFSLPAPEISSVSAPVETAPPTPISPKATAAAPISSVAAIEPQPEIAEVFAEPNLTAAPALIAKPGNKILKIVGAVAGLLLMLIVVIAFLVFIYYFFFQKAAE